DRQTDYDCFSNRSHKPPLSSAKTTDATRHSSAVTTPLGAVAAAVARLSRARELQPTRLPLQSQLVRFLFQRFNHVMLSAVIFDLDGVLADSEPWWSEIDAKLLAEYGVTYRGEHHQNVVGVCYRLAVEFYKKA